MKNRKKAFSIVYAIVIMVLIATIAAYTLSMSAQSAKTTTDEHIRIQMQLYMKSTIEYALLWLSGEKNERTDDISGSGCSTSSNMLQLNYDDQYFFNVRICQIEGAKSLLESNGTVMIDVNGTTALMDEPYHITKRLLVKP